MLQNVWKEIRNPNTGRLIGKYCPQTHQFEVVERGQRAVVKLPEPEPVVQVLSKS